MVAAAAIGSMAVSSFSIQESSTSSAGPGKSAPMASAWPIRPIGSSGMGLAAVTRSLPALVGDGQRVEAQIAIERLASLPPLEEPHREIGERRRERLVRG